MVFKDSYSKEKLKKALMQLNLNMICNVLRKAIKDVEENRSENFFYHKVITKGLLINYQGAFIPFSALVYVK